MTPRTVARGRSTRSGQSRSGRRRRFPTWPGWRIVQGVGGFRRVHRPSGDRHRFGAPADRAGPLRRRWRPTGVDRRGAQPLRDAARPCRRAGAADPPSTRSGWASWLPPPASSRCGEIVTELPGHSLRRRPTRCRGSRRPARRRGSQGRGSPDTVGSRRRASPWAVLGLLVLVAVVVLVFFAVYAEHLIHSHGRDARARPVALPLSALRL